MGEGTSLVSTGNGSAARVRALDEETGAVRRQLDDLLMELDRRRHEALDWRLQIRRHGRAIALAAGGIAAAATLIVAVYRARARRQATLAARLSEISDRGDRLRRALARIIEDPDRLAPDEPARFSKRRFDGPTVASLALAAGKIALPHVVAAMSRRRRPEV
jgi:hypothetical protein